MKMPSMQLEVWSSEEVHVGARCSASPSRLNCNVQDILKRTEAPNPAAFHLQSTLNINGKFSKPKEYTSPWKIVQRAGKFSMVSGLPEFILNVLWFLHFSSAKANSSVLSQRNRTGNNQRDICNKKKMYCRSTGCPYRIIPLDLIPCTFKFTYLFIFGCVGSSLLCAGFLQLQRAGATLPSSAGASHCGSFSCCGAQALGARASVVVAHGLSRCGMRAQLLRSMWDLPRPGLEPVSPALAGGLFLTTAPPGKPSQFIFNKLKRYGC